MKTFKDKKTSVLFYNLFKAIRLSKQKAFSREVRELADTKVTSDEHIGDFYVSQNDLLTIAKKYE